MGKVLFAIGVLAILISVAIVKNDTEVITRIDDASQQLAIHSYNTGFWESAKYYCENMYYDSTLSGREAMANECKARVQKQFDTASRQFATDLKELNDQATQRFSK